MSEFNRFGLNGLVGAQQFFQVGCGHLSYMADAVAALGSLAQQFQALDIGISIKPPVGVGAVGYHGLVASLPDADDMRGKPRAPHYHLHWISR